jgi:large subunit ribosomal protein L6
VSRIGKQPIDLPDGVDATILAGSVKIKGSNGQLEVPVHPLTEVNQVDGTIRVTVSNPNDRHARALWGLTRSLLANAVEGVTKGFEKRLAIVGVGYRADVKGKNLDLQVGYSHPVVVEPLPGIEFSIDEPPAGIEGAQSSIVIKGADKELVGRSAANIRKIRPPEPYKGKGIRYHDEYVRRKAGKAAVT